MLINFNCQLCYLLTSLVALGFDFVDMLNFSLSSLKKVHIESINFLKVLLEIAVLQKQILVLSLKVAGLLFIKLCLLSQIYLI